MGLRARIAITLGLVLAAFILLTELSVTRLVRVTFERQSTATGDDDDTAHGLTATAETDLRALRRIVLFYLVFGAVLALALGTFAITRLVVRPLNRITHAVEEVAAGHLATDVPIGGSGELVRLGVAFNHMTTTLSSQRNEIIRRLAELETAQSRLVRSAKLASVGTLAAGIAHEIGNPLAGVLGLLEASEHTADPDTIARYRDVMRKELERIDRVIRELLAFARPHQPDSESGARLGRVRDHVESLLRAQRTFDRIRIEWELPDALPAMALSEDELTQVLLNLALNSVHAIIGPGTIRISARIERSHTPGFPGRGIIEFSDDGPGVPASVAEQIFEPFFSTRQAGEGAGLGLAICQVICDRAGGEIRLEPNNDQGASFFITLPLVNESVPPDDGSLPAGRGRDTVTQNENEGELEP